MKHQFPLAHFGMNCHVFTHAVNKAFYWLSIIMWDQSTHGQCVTYSDDCKAVLSFYNQNEVYKHELLILILTNISI